MAEYLVKIVSRPTTTDKVDHKDTLSYGGIVAISVVIAGILFIILVLLIVVKQQKTRPLERLFLCCRRKPQQPDLENNNPIKAEARSSFLRLLVASLNNYGFLRPAVEHVH